MTRAIVPPASDRGIRLDATGMEGTTVHGNKARFTWDVGNLTVTIFTPSNQAAVSLDGDHKIGSRTDGLDSGACIGGDVLDVVFGCTTPGKEITCVIECECGVNGSGYVHKDFGFVDARNTRLTELILTTPRNK